MSETGRVENTIGPLPFRGLRTRAEPHQAGVGASSKCDNFVLGKAGGLTGRLGLKKITASKILPPSLELNGHNSSYLRLRTNDLTDPGTTSYGISFRARVQGIKAAAPNAAKEIVGWDTDVPVGAGQIDDAHYRSPEQLFHDSPGLNLPDFKPGAIVCVAATTDPYHAARTAADGASVGIGAGWGIYAIQDAVTGHWYPVLILHSWLDWKNAAGNVQPSVPITLACAPYRAGDKHYDPFEEHTYLVALDYPGAMPAVYSDQHLFFRIDDEHKAAADDADHVYYIAGGKDAANSILQMNFFHTLWTKPVFIGGAPDVDHFHTEDISEWNRDVHEFAPSLYTSCINPLKVHLPAHLAVADLALWDTENDAAEDFEDFWDYFSTSGYTAGTRIVASDPGNENRLAAHYPMNEDRGHPVNSKGDHVLDILSSSPIREKDGWATGVQELRFGGMAPMIIPNGDLYRKQFGGHRGKYGCLYPLDSESYFIFWRPDSLQNPNSQVVASFISPQNTGDGLQEEKTYEEGNVRGFTDKGAVHWGIKIVHATRDTPSLAPEMHEGHVYAVFFAKGREFSASDPNPNHDDDLIKQCNVAVYGTRTGQAVELGASAAAVLGKKYIFSYSRVAEWNEETEEYTSNIVTIKAFEVGGSQVGSDGVIDLGDSGSAHLIHEGADQTSYSVADCQYEQNTSLFPTWLTEHMGLKKYYLVVGGWVQPGWSGPENISDIVNVGGSSSVGRVTFRTEEIDSDGGAEAADDKIAGQPDDQEGWMGIPEQAGGMHSYRFTKEQKSDSMAVAISSVDRSRIHNVSKRDPGGGDHYIEYPAGAGPFEYVLEIGPPGATETFTMSSHASSLAGWKMFAQAKNFIAVYTVLQRRITFVPATAKSKAGAVYKFCSNAGLPEADEEWVFILTPVAGGVSISTATGVFDHAADGATGVANFKFRHTIIGAIGATCGFGFLSSPLSNDDMAFLASEGSVTDEVVDKFRTRAISIWNFQEPHGTRFLDSVGPNTISDSNLFPITACPKTVEKAYFVSDEYLELDLHHSLPWGLYSFTDRCGIRRTESVFSSDAGAAEEVGLLETRERAGVSRQYVVSSAGVFEICRDSGTSAPSFRHIGTIPGEIPEGAVLYFQRWDQEVFFTLGAGRPMRLTSKGKLIETGRTERPRLWWNKHKLIGGDVSAEEDVDFYCHGFTDDSDAPELETDVVISGSRGIFDNRTDLHPQFPTDPVTEPIYSKRWPTPGGDGFSYCESFHASLIPHMQTAPSLAAEAFKETPLFDMPAEENIRCIFYWFVTGVNKNYDPPIETPRSPIFMWNRVYTDASDTEETRHAGFFTRWFSVESQNTFAKIVATLSKSPSPDITHLRVWRTPRGGGDFYYEDEYELPSGYGSDGQIFKFEVCNRPDSELQEVNTTLLSYSPPSGVRFCVAHAGRMFYAGDPVFPDRVWYSPIGDPGSAPPLYYKSCLGIVVGLKAERDRLVVTTEDDTFELTSFAFDYGEVTKEEMNTSGPPVAIEHVKAGIGGLSGRSMVAIDDLGLTVATQKSIAIRREGGIFTVSDYIDGFSFRDVPSSNDPKLTSYRMIYPHALNVADSGSWIGAYDRFNGLFVLLCSLAGSTLGNNVAIVWDLKHPSVAEDGLSREFTTYSFLEADDALSAELDGLYFRDIIEIKSELSGRPELWALASNGYIYQFGAGESDGVDYQCLEGTSWETLRKFGRVYKDNSSKIAPWLRWSMTEEYESPGGTYKYRPPGRGADAELIGVEALFTALATYGITEPFVGAPIVFTNRVNGVVHYRTITAAAQAGPVSGSTRKYLRVTLNATLPDVPGDNWDYEIGAIYKEHVSGRGGIWNHNKEGVTHQIDFTQKSTDHRVDHNTYTAEEVSTAMRAKEGDGLILPSGAYGGYSGWAPVDTAAKWTANLTYHPQGATPISSIPGPLSAALGAYVLDGYFSYYGAWPLVRGAVPGAGQILIDHLWTSFRMMLPSGLAACPSHGVVMSYTTEYRPTYDSTYSTDMTAKFDLYRAQAFAKLFLDAGIPVILLPGLNYHFPDESYCSDAADFDQACFMNYMNKSGDLANASIQASQAYAYLTAWGVLRLVVASDFPGSIADLENFVAYGHGDRGLAARLAVMCGDDGPVSGSAVITTGTRSDAFDQHLQRRRKVAIGGLGNLAGHEAFEEKLASTARGKEFRDFFDFGCFAAQFAQKGRAVYPMVQVEDDNVAVVAGEYGGSYASFSERERTLLGMPVTVTGASIVVANDVVGTYDLTLAGVTFTSLGFAGVFSKFPQPTGEANSLLITLTMSGGGPYTCYSHGTSEGVDSDGNTYDILYSQLGGADDLQVGAHFHKSGLIVFDTGYITAQTSESVTAVTVTGYKLDAKGDPSDANLTALQKNYVLGEAGTRSEHVISSVTVTHDRMNERIKVVVAYTAAAGDLEINTIRVVAAVDDPADMDGNHLFESPKSIKTASSTGSWTADGTEIFYIDWSDLGITKPDSDGRVVVLVAEAGNDSNGWIQSSRPVVLNISTLIEYEQAYALDPVFVSGAEYDLIYTYEGDEFASETMKATAEHATVADIKGNGRTFRWGIRSVSADRPIEINGDVILTVGDGAIRSGSSRQG